MNEEAQAASILAELLVSALMRAHTERRTWLYIWERDGLRWLIRYRDRRPKGVFNDWVGTFIKLNREAILSEDAPMDFNLRAFRERVAYQDRVGL